MSRLFVMRGLCNVGGGVTLTTVANTMRQASGSLVRTQGWLRSVQRHRQHMFGWLEDGLSCDKLQIVLTSSPAVKELRVGSFVQVSGELVQTPHRSQTCELHCSSLDISTSPSTEWKNLLPTPAARANWRLMRQHVLQRPRSSTFSALLRARAGLVRLLQRHLDDEQFVHVHTPLLTAADCEGAGAVLHVAHRSVSGGEKETGHDSASNDGSSSCDDTQRTTEWRRDFFGHDVHLSVSGQLHLEAIASGVSRVYCLGPAFRAELSRTHRHLAEFYMLEAEMAGVTSGRQLTEHVQHLLQQVIAQFLLQYDAELRVIRPEQYDSTKSMLERVCSEQFVSMTYSEAIDLLTEHHASTTSHQSSSSSSSSGRRAAPTLGQDLSRDDELLLTRLAGGVPVFVTRWPARLKPFYVKRSHNDDEWSDSVDLLVPGVGELLGGSVREHCAHRLRQRMADLLPQLQWYVDLRLAGGAPTAGYGLGVDRLLAMITAVDSLRDTLPFPRWYGNCVA